MLINKYGLTGKPNIEWERLRPKNIAFFISTEILEMDVKSVDKDKNLLTPHIGVAKKKFGLLDNEIYHTLKYKKDWFVQFSQKLDGYPISKFYILIKTLKSFKKEAIAGCYSITTPSGRVYIGETIDMCKRKSQHYEDLMNDTHHNIKLQSEYNDCKDISTFKFTPLTTFNAYKTDVYCTKHKTLYLEAAHYLNCLLSGHNMCNTIHPFTSLLNQELTFLNCGNLELNFDEIYFNLLRDEFNICSDATRQFLLNTFSEPVIKGFKRHEWINSHLVSEGYKYKGTLLNSIPRRYEDYKKKMKMSKMKVDELIDLCNTFNIIISETNEDDYQQLDMSVFEEYLSNQ